MLLLFLLLHTHTDSYTPLIVYRETVFSFHLFPTNSNLEIVLILDPNMNDKDIMVENLLEISV